MTLHTQPAPILFFTQRYASHLPTLLQDEFLENLHKAADALQHLIPQVIEFIAGKRLSEL